jgi:hypothetical protein
MTENNNIPIKTNGVTQELSQASEEKIPMPISVIVAIVIISILMFITFFSKQSNTGIYATLCYALILLGVFKRHPLAWQWGRIVPIMWVISGLLTLLGYFSKDMDNLTALKILFIAIGLRGTIPVLFSLQDSRLYFGLKCPACGKFEGKAANFMFTTKRCRSCGHIWGR